MRLASVVLLVAVAGCGASLSEVRAEVKRTSQALSDCRDEARVAFFVDRKTEAEALAIYEACKKRNGL